MRRHRIAAGAAALALLAFAPAAHAARRLDGPADIYTATSGNWSKAANWTLGHPPNSGTPATIPLGDHVTISRSGAESASLTVAGALTGRYGLRVNGSLEVPGTLALEEASITLTGLGTINLGSNTVDYLRLQDIHRLTGPLHVLDDLDVEGGASLNAAGYDVTVGREAYSYLGSSLIGGAGTWRVGEWFIYAGPWDEGQEAQLEDTSVIVDRPVVEDETFGATNTYACLCGWTYRNFTLEGYEPRTYGSAIGGGAAGGNILDTLTLNRSTGGITLAPATITTAELATDGTAAAPAVVRSSGATIRIPHDETLDGCLQLEGVTVEGGTLTQDC